jgi:hypothetical protein
MGNAVPMEDTDIVKVHDRVYPELRRLLPAGGLSPLTAAVPCIGRSQNRRFRTHQEDSQLLRKKGPIKTASSKGTAIFTVTALTCGGSRINSRRERVRSHLNH